MKHQKKPVDTARKRPSEIERLKVQNKKLRAKLRAEEANWFQKCPQGHLVRHDECDIMCYVTTISSVESPHLDALAENYRALDRQFAVDKKIGWWWRVPFSWWLSLKKWWNMSEDEVAARGIIKGIKDRSAL